MVDRVIIGNDSSRGYGLFVSKPGADVKSCADSELLFDSRRTYFGQLLIAQNETLGANGSVTRTFNPQGRDCYSQVFSEVTQYTITQADLGFIGFESSNTSSPKVTCELSISSETSATYTLSENHGAAIDVLLCIWRVDR